MAGIIVPTFENSFNITRIFEMTYLFLAPFAIFGGVIILKSVLKALNIDSNPIKVFSVFLIL